MGYTNSPTYIRTHIQRVTHLYIKRSSRPNVSQTNMKLKNQCKEDNERTAPTRENNVQRLRKRNRLLKNNLKDKRSKFGVVRQTGFPSLKHQLNINSASRWQLSEKSLWTAKEMWLLTCPAPNWVGGWMWSILKPLTIYVMGTVSAPKYWSHAWGQAIGDCSQQTQGTQERK